MTFDSNDVGTSPQKNFYQIYSSCITSLKAEAAKDAGIFKDWSWGQK